MPKLRGYLIGALAGAALTLTGMLGGMALADIPDTEPSAPDPAHTLYWCVQRPSGPTSTPNRPVYAFDHSLALAQGKPDCAAVLGPNWDTVRSVPAVPPNSP